MKKMSRLVINNMALFIMWGGGQFNDLLKCKINISIPLFPLLFYTTRIDKKIDRKWMTQIIIKKTRVDIGHPGLCWVHLFNLLNRFIRFLLKISMILKKIVSKRNKKKIHFGLSKVPNNRVTRSRIKTWYRYFLHSFFLGENIKYQGISRKPEIK